ncbi:quinol monooxygenase YgiN [Kineosphaera limosa]|uniref:ABM domain-containing protein n=1 Tax=Kineosphaera limosa NBRC 100340 TaxID=1184609 RepID=K6VI49_9MICO|nr:putative quinol monooxygenase [Kineosphaera limosa]NYE01310.1 quinol monooxygenase YgiN [Kineosphaera limosa]GAB95893.1 hypothetical protein KILIM_029_00020 [Kineosphaera limosa NBRC 100340]
MTSFYAEFTAAAGREDDCARLVADYTQATRAEEGCVVFEPYVERDRPRRYFIYEVYEDDQAFADHVASPHGVQFNEQLGDVIEEDASRLKFLDRPPLND